MNLFFFLSVVQAFIAAGLVILVLMQRSEGGGLGMGGGGSPGGLMSARGAADFLTRATKWFAVFFVGLAIVLAALAVENSGERELDDTLDRSTGTPAQNDPAADPAAAPAGDAAGEAPAAAPTPGPASDLAQ
ncbi:MAG: preprotein translocase subunit SecG [Erythrobacter sp.]|nr:preprotein translocase subunit SecG [Erythrobacter sp.]